jgi:hypothetical protein
VGVYFCAGFVEPIAFCVADLTGSDEALGLGAGYAGALLNDFVET